VVDAAGPILTAAVLQVFGQTDPAGPEPPQGSTPGLAVPEPDQPTTGMTSAEDLLTQAREGLHQEWASLQILGRALTEQEKQRSDALSRAVKLIDEALAALRAGD
jgi:hypothetical protein